MFPHRSLGRNFILAAQTLRHACNMRMFHNERGSIFYKHVHDVSYSGIDEFHLLESNQSIQEQIIYTLNRAQNCFKKFESMYTSVK
jgi:hypothetical protein